jgi:hypothetical protein
MFVLYARLWGEREGTRRVVGLQPTDLFRGDGEGEVGGAELASCGLPHLIPTLSAPKGGEGEIGGAFRGERLVAHGLMPPQRRPLS